jgi:hypothetical protein
VPDRCLGRCSRRNLFIYRMRAAKAG